MASLARLATIGVEQVKGFGGNNAKSLRETGLDTVADLLLFVPRRYLDRTTMAPIMSVPVGVEVTVAGTVTSIDERRPKKGLLLTEAIVEDESGRLRVIWFNQKFRAKQLPPGTEVALSGKIEWFRGTRQMSSPAADVFGNIEGLTTGRLVPLYPKVGTIKPGMVRRGIHNALRRSRPIEDSIPQPIIDALDLVDRDTAFATIHFPESDGLLAGARRRLIFDEFFRLELALALRKRRQVEEATGIAHVLEGDLVERFLAGLPYSLTEAQKRVLAEIEADLRSSHPMHRLLEGEVGSGKTVVAVAALLSAVQGGYQGAVMAPTEVLAQQHFLAIQSLLEGAGVAGDYGCGSLFDSEGRKVRLALLTSSQAASGHDPGIKRDEVLQGVANGEIDLVVGTHALIQEGVEFRSLGAAVVDEQHRFGVGQRVLLKEKGKEEEPDLMIMTATPIPRTLAFTLYGDLDVSVIDELPPGRQPIETIALPPAMEDMAWDAVRSEVAAGRQAFVVCPLVEDSEKIEAASATAEFQRLQHVFPDLRLGLVHGQLTTAEKDAVMRAFRAGEIDVLVATTVIEVGIDVPNATVMVVEDADRFGLSQLHQLRGRVGRGDQPARCYLLSDPPEESEGAARIGAMVATNDGRRLAEEDLRIRGQGTVFGARQSGMPDLRLADVLRDKRELVDARREAFDLVAGDPDLTGHPDLREEMRLLLGENVEWLFKS
jgi:ATP-dependent DNA helicase RecG